MTVGRSLPLFGPCSSSSGGGGTADLRACEPRKEGLLWTVPTLSHALCQSFLIWG